MKRIILFTLMLALLLSGCASPDLNSNNKAADTGLASSQDSSSKNSEFMEVGTQYDLVLEPKLVAGKLAFTILDTKKNEFGIVYDGKEYMNTSLFQVGDKAAFLVRNGDKGFIEYDGKEIGKEYYSIDYVADVNGKLLFTARKDETYYPFANGVVVYDGEVQTGYDSLSQLFGISSSAEPIAVNGKLAFVAGKNKGAVVIYNNGILGSEYDYIIDLKNIGEKVGFIGKTSGGYAVILDGRQIYEGPEIEDLIDANGKPAFIATENGKSSVIYDGKRFGESYDDISDLTYSSGKIAFVAKKNGRIGFAGGSGTTVVIDGKELGEGYKVADYYSTQLKSIGEQLVFAVWKNGEVYVIYGDREFGPYPGIPKILNLKGKPAFYFRGLSGEYIVYDGKQVGGKYESAISGGHYPISVNGKLAFSASNGCSNDVYVSTCKKFIVYDGKEIGKEYDSARGTFDIGGKLAFYASNCEKRGQGNRCVRFKNFLVLEK